MLKEIIDWFKKLFGVTPLKTELEQTEEMTFTSRYEDIAEINLVSIIANRLANIVCSEAKINVIGGSKRAEFLDTSLNRSVERLKLITTRTFGTGGVILKPYTHNGQIYTDILPQNRFFIVEQQGEIITKAGFIADKITIDEKEYTRVEYHSLDQNGVYLIETKALRDGKEVALSSVPAWAAFEPVITISGVEQMLFAILKCPTDSKKSTAGVYGVPVTYGQDKLIKTIVDLFNEIPDEYKNKKAFIGAEDLLFSSDDKLPESGIYKLFRANGGVDNKSFWEVFSPEIRHTSYFEGLDYLFSLLEKSIAVNRGVLTDLDTADATATAIKRSLFDTFNLVDGMRKNIERAVGQLVYSYNVIANAFNLCPPGDYEEIKFDWSFILLEDSAETFNQLVQGQSVGAVKPEEIRMFLFSEDEETAVKNLPPADELMQL